MGDIGKLFPDNDERYLGADSLVLLREVMRRLREAGYELCNADCTVLAQRPKLVLHIPAMRANIAEAMVRTGGAYKRQGHHRRGAWLYRQRRGHRRARRCFN